MTKKEDVNENEQPAINNIIKYSVVLRCWSVPHEINIIDIIPYKNKFTHQEFFKFIDETGRLWENVRQDEVIRIKHFPDKKDFDDIDRLKRETKKLEDEETNKKPDFEDVSIQ
ncbi:MAG: hypothetical protein ABH833_00300 [Parcubacteria group bacterium]